MTPIEIVAAIKMAAKAAEALGGWVVRRLRYL